MKKILLIIALILCISQISVLATDYTADLTVQMTADDAPSPNVTSASRSDWGTSSYIAFDHNETGSNKWNPADNVCWIKFDFGSALYAIAQYTILPPDEDHMERMPKDWTFQGSNNDSDWVTLDTQTAETFTQHTRKTYPFSNSTKYRYYKLDITENANGANNTTIQEIQMMEEEEAADNAIFFGTNF